MHKPHEFSPAQKRLFGAQYRTLNIKTESEDALKTLLTACQDKPNARVAWMKHEEEGKHPHFHFAASFTAPVRLAEALEAVMLADPHAYIKPCRNFRASVRYLAHLDNPEKEQYDPANIALVGDWDGCNLQTLFERKGSNLAIGDIIRLAVAYCLEVGGCSEGSPMRFAVWLDSHGYNSRKAFYTLRMMGFQWYDLMSEILPTVNRELALKDAPSSLG